MRDAGTFFSRDIIDTAPPTIAFLMLAIASLTFAYDQASSELLGLANVKLPVGSDFIVLAILIVLFPLVFLRIWTDNRLKVVMYLSWALYLPSALFFSGFDPLKIISLPENFGMLSSTLPEIVVIAAGIALASGSLLNRSFMQIKKARDNFLGRGAERDEARRALNQNAIFETKIILASAAAVLVIVAGVPFAQDRLLGILKSFGFVYLLTGLGAVVILALIFVIFLWPRKNGEKG